MSIVDRIQRKFPLFRHNDMHIGNLLVDEKCKIRLTDFELSRISNRGPRTIKSYGITNRYNPYYDIHCFLNSLWRTGKFKIVNKFLPVAFRGKITRYVKNYRLTF